MMDIFSKTAGKRLGWRILSVILIFALLGTAGIVVAEVAESYDSRVVDGNTSDPSGVFSNEVGSDGVPIDDGRIWTDKTVTLGSELDEFDITLSALGQSFNIETDVPVPSDTVIIIDVSTSMRTNNVGTGPSARSRIAVLVDALNVSIRTLLDAHPENRIAVIAYGGTTTGSGVNVRQLSRIQHVLELGRPEVTGNIFTMQGTNQVRVNAGVSNSLLHPDTANRLISVDGATPTQRGIYAGARILLNNTDTTIMVEGVEVTRSPNIILMTDGEPTLGWTDFKFANSVSDTNDGFDIGFITASHESLALLTVLTAAHRKQLVENHYGVPAGFYTIGFGENSMLVLSSMDPAGTHPQHGTNASGINLIVPPGGNNQLSMQNLLNNFLQYGEITFQTAGKQPNQNTRRMATVENAVGAGAVISWDYADLSFSAMNVAELERAFKAITEAITLVDTNYPTRLNGVGANFAGHIVFTDVLGEYMEFRGINEMRFGGQTYYASSLGTYDLIDTNSPARADFIRVMMNQHIAAVSGNPISYAQAAALLDSNIAAGNISLGRVVYFANAQGEFVSSAYDSNGNRVAAPSAAASLTAQYMFRGEALDPVSGELTDLMYSAFYVVTALADGYFECAFKDGENLQRFLRTGEQLVRWYIPASLIPLRDVTPSGTVTANPPPFQVAYTIGLNMERIHAAESASALHTNRWSDEEGFTNVSQAFFRPHPENPFYSAASAASKDKDVNVTETAPYVWSRSDFAGANGTPVWAYRLGNNGQIDAPPDPGYKVTIIVVDEDGEPIPGATVTIRDEDGEIVFEAETDEDGRVSTVLPDGDYTATATHPDFEDGDDEFTVDGEDVERIIVLRVPEPNDDASLEIIKTFSGLEEVGDIDVRDFVSNISFLIRGVNADDEEIFRQVVQLSEFDVVNGGLRFELTDLPYGIYTIYERGGYAERFKLTRPEPTSVELANDEPISVTIENVYTPIYYPPALRLVKVFHGLTDSEIPPNFEIVISGPEEFGEQVFTLADVAAGIYFENLYSGEYTIIERNSEVDGFEMMVEVAADFENVTVTLEPELLISLEVAEGAYDLELKIVIENIYEPEEEDAPDPGPNPTPNRRPPTWTVDRTPPDPVDPPITPEWNPTHYAYIIGYPDGYVRPQGNITRAEVATIFFRLISDEYRAEIWLQSNPFSDVVLEQWFNNAISTMTNGGVLRGYPDGTFVPNAAITRAEVAAIVSRFADANHSGADLFSDISGHWANEKINAAANVGWLQGYPDGTFRPDALITRAEFATVVNRVLERIPETPNDLLPNMVAWPDNANVNAWYYLAMQEATNSHNHERRGAFEYWTELILPRWWAVLELPTSQPQDILE